MSTTLKPHLSVAPMLEWTDRHARFLMRLLTHKTTLFTEMVTTGAILYGDKQRHLDFSQEEHPIVCQLGGSNPEELATCARLIEHWGYDEINLNIGCPSNRVQNGFFGACLMAHPQKVADCIKAMQDAVSIPITVKCRIGIDDFDSYPFFENFINIVADNGCKRFYVHARKALLSGLSPKENREIPPLCYPYAYQLKQQYPHLDIIVNGGIKSFEETKEHLKHVDGVMFGRVAYKTPWFLATIDETFYHTANPIKTRHQALSLYTRYMREQWNQGTPLWPMARHLMGLYHAQPKGRLFRQYISQKACHKQASPDIFNTLLDEMSF